MSFLGFGKKAKGGNGSAGSSRDLDSRQGAHPTAANGAPAGPKGAGQAPQLQGPDNRKRSEDSSMASRPPGLNNNDKSLFPWSCQELHFVTAAANPFPRYGAAVNSTASKEGDVYMMGGLIDGQTVKGDLWMVEAAADKLSCYPVKTEQEGPGPRVGHASLLVGNAFIVFGGDTKQSENDDLDDTLYLLNTSTKLWSRALPPGTRPAGRYGHTLNILGSKLFIFGGQNDGHFFNDLVAFDLNQLQNPEHTWEVLVNDSEEVPNPNVLCPPARTNHTTVTYNDRLYMFGGTDGVQWFNDVWTYDPRTNKWSQLDCIGYIPQPREGHSAALVNDVMYVFGGRTQGGEDLPDLAAFRITSRRWYTFQNMGPAPSPRSGHSMTAFDKKIVVVGGEPSSNERDPEELSLVYILDTTKIKYPNDSSAQAAERNAPGNRRPSQGQSSIPRGAPVVAPPGTSPPNNGPPPGSRLPKPAGAGGPPTGPPPAGPPGGPPPGGPLPGGPPLRGPPPRVNGNGPLGGPQPGSRSGTPTRGYEPAQNSPYGRPDLAAAADAGRGPQSRSMSPALQARPPINQPQPSRLGASDDAAYDQTRNRSQSQTQRPIPQLAVDPSAYGLAPAPAVTTTPALAPNPSIQNSNSQVQSQAQAQQPPPQQQQAQSQTQNPAQYSQESITTMDSSSVRAAPAPPQLRTQDSATNAQLESLRQELESIRKKAALYESELALARKAGYQSTTAGSLPDERSIVNESDRPLVEALVLMKKELDDVQTSVSSRVQDATKKVADAEAQRDAAIKEAVYAKAKLAAHGGSSQAGTPQLDDSTRDLDHDRHTEISRRLGTALTLQNDLRSKLAEASAQHEAEKRAREVAEQNAEAAHRRAAELEQTRNPGELEELRADLHVAQKTARDEGAKRADHESKAKMLEIERDDLKRQLEDYSSTSTDHEASLAYLRSAMNASQEKADLLESKLQREREEREAALAKLQSLRAEHEERTAELDQTSRRLRDMEELAEKHAQEASTHKNAVMMGFKDRSDKRSDSSASNKAAEQRIAVLQQQADDATELARRSQNEADTAAEKLRGAEERIAGLETFQQQASRENLTIRKQLQEAIKTAQALQAQHQETRRELESHQRSASALSLQHGALKDLLDERSDMVGGSRGLGGSPDMQQRVRELEQRLEESERRQEESRVEFEAGLNDTESAYREKLEQLESDYQSAVSYVKGTEKMLKRMKDELTRSKAVNTRLEKDLDRAQRSGSRSGSQPPPGEWEAEKRRLQQEIEETQRQVKGQLAALEAQLADVQAERETARLESETLSHSMQETRSELERLRADNATLEARAADAENKVSLLLDQVETSVDNYRRQSRASMGVNGTGGHGGNHHGGHARTASSGSNYTAQGGLGSGGYAGHTRTGSGGSESVFSNQGGSTTGGVERGSVALDNLANELENLRTQWEGTHRSYRFSNSYNLGLNRLSSDGGAGGSGGADIHGGGLSDSLASWRKRLDAEERSKASSREDSRTGDRSAAHAAAVASSSATARAAAGVGGENMI